MRVDDPLRSWEQALRVLRQLRLEGVKENLMTYPTIIDVLGSAQQWQRALDLLTLDF